MWLRRSLPKASALYPLLDTQLQRVGGTRRQIVGSLAHRGRRKGKANGRGQEPVNFFSALLMDCTHQSLLWTLWPPTVRRNLQFSMLGTTSIYQCTKRKWRTVFGLIFIAYKVAALTYCVSDIFLWFSFCRTTQRPYVLDAHNRLDFTVSIAETFDFWYRLRTPNEWLTDEVSYNYCVCFKRSLFTNENCLVSVIV